MILILCGFLYYINVWLFSFIFKSSNSIIQILKTVARWFIAENSSNSDEDESCCYRNLIHSFWPITVQDSAAQCSLVCSYTKYFCFCLFPPPLGRRSSRERRWHTMTSATSKHASCTIWVSVCAVTESHRLHCVLVKFPDSRHLWGFFLVQERCIQCWERWTTEYQKRQVFYWQVTDRTGQPLAFYHPLLSSFYFC